MGGRRASIKRVRGGGLTVNLNINKRGGRGCLNERDEGGARGLKIFLGQK